MRPVNHINRLPSTPDHNFSWRFLLLQKCLINTKLQQSEKTVFHFSLSLSMGKTLFSGLTVHGPPGSLVAPLGSSVVLPCYVDELLSVEGLEVEWRRPDSETLVHLHSARLFTAEIPKGNFSLRLKSIRTEDKGVYMCERVLFSHSPTFICCWY
uniref:Ig-like domain-containing protein n=1 Tax=Sinocyclocheilus anshuiensis TaxID=1608454 RepID=A0A671S7R1_9TELE